MLRSIRETQKLFSIEGMQGGEVNIRTSQYLLSLPKDKQIELLTEHLENLKRDLARYADPTLQDSNGKDDNIDKAQLQILIEVTEGLLSQI
jgi:hypothetical protein